MSATRLERGVLTGICVLVLTAGHYAAAQDEASGTPAKDLDSQIAEIYERTKTAEKLEDFSSIAELCSQALQSPTTRPQAVYLNQLEAWALNRRGQLIAEQASELLEQGQQEEAARLEQKALADFERAVEKDPSRWRALHNRGVSYALAGRLSDAIDDFSRVIQLNEDHGKAWFNRAESHYSLGNFEQAIRDYSRVVQLTPDDTKARVNRGHAYFQMRRFREALADYDRAIQLEPRSAELAANRADANQSLGRWEQAARDYQQAVRLDPQLARGLQGAAWLMATCPDARFRDAETAVQAAERAVELGGDEDFRALDTLAAAQASAGKFDEAQETLTQAIGRAPEGEQDALRQRMNLYQQNQPYRQGMSQQ